MRTLFFIAGICILTALFGQKAEAKKKPTLPESTDTTIYEKVIQMPLFQKKPWKTFVRWAAERVEYPPTLRDQGLGGRVVVRFVIEKDGSINEVEVLESPYLLLSAEVIRVIGLSPKWTPARNENGETVRVYVKVPFSFAITDPHQDRSLPPQLRQAQRY
ncbi:MAG: energy transducer TonB [Rikenella sp.]|nr:energy transducer TonB [Rikenella sp.]